MTHKEDEQTCIMVGPGAEGKGGISSVVQVYRDAGLFDSGDIIVLSSFMHGSSLKKAKDATFALLRYCWLLARGRGAVLHVHVASRASFWRKSLFIWAAALTRRRIVFHSHSGGFVAFIEQLPPIQYFIATTTINRCDQILCLTSSMQAWFEKLAPRVPVQWWPNPIPADLFDMGTPTAEREPIVLHLGALVYAKGVMDLLNAFLLLHHHDPTARLVVGGSGPALDEMQDFVRCHNLTDCVMFPGWIGPEEKKSWLRRARVLALASHVEAQPMVLLEAMASGAAVVSTDVGGIPDVVKSGVQGLLVSPHRPVAFSENLIRVWDDVPLRERLVRAAYESVSKLHKADEACRSLQQLYGRMIRRKRSTLSTRALALRYRLIDWVRGSDAIGLLDRLRVWQFQSPAQLERKSAEELGRYLVELRNALPLYRHAEKYDDLPVIDKRFIQEHRNDLMNPFYSGKIIKKKTGGSTGEPLVYYTGTQSHSYLWAGIFLSWEVAGYRFGDKVAIMAGSSLFATGSKQSIYYSLMNVKVISTFDLSADAMLDIGRRLEHDGFRLLYGFSSAIHRVARFFLERRQTLNTRLRGIVCTAEVLTEGMRKDIEAAFGVRCYGQYGCHDAGISAFECERQNGYHLISTRCHFEVQPDGKLVSTDLMNRTMFMPRYNTGDMVRMTGRVCSCGRGLPLIDEVIGRQNDVVVDGSGHAVHSEFFTHMFREDDRIFSFQVLFSDRALQVNLHVKPNCDAMFPDLEAAIRAKVAKVLVFEDVRISFNEPFVQIANGKHRFVLKADLA